MACAPGIPGTSLMFLSWSVIGSQESRCWAEQMIGNPQNSKTTRERSRRIHISSRKNGELKSGGGGEEYITKNLSWPE
jgi:hypothetical protein